MSNSTLTYDDANLQRLFAELEVSQRVKALKGAFRRQANSVRKTALNNLRRSIRTDKDLEKGVRAIVFKRAAGFRVTIGTTMRKGAAQYGFHKNRQGLLKPVLLWAEGGTEQRHTKSKTRIFTRSRKGHATGRMKRYGFMKQTADQVRSTVTNDLHTEVANNVIKTAKKYGCK